MGRFRHWLRLLLVENHPCLTNQIMEVGDQAFKLKCLISTLETICNRHKLAMPKNQGLFPLRGLDSISQTLAVFIVFFCPCC